MGQGQGRRMGGGDGSHPRTALPKYAGPLIRATDYVRPSGDFVSEQAYVDAAFICEQELGVTETLLRAPDGGWDYTGNPLFINGVYQQATIDGQPNGLGTAANIDFSQHPPSDSVVAAVAAASAYRAQVKAAKHPEATAAAQLVGLPGGRVGRFAHMTTAEIAATVERIKQHRGR